MKKMKKIKIITFFMILTIIVLAFFQVSKAAFTVRNLTGTPISSPETEEFGNKIITVISTIGSILSVIVLVVIGIKYLMGSIEEKAEYKKTLMPYIIGALLIFSASTIAGIIYQIAPK